MIIKLHNKVSVDGYKYNWMTVKPMYPNDIKRAIKHIRKTFQYVKIQAPVSDTTARVGKAKRTIFLRHITLSFNSESDAAYFTMWSSNGIEI